MEKTEGHYEDHPDDMDILSTLKKNNNIYINLYTMNIKIVYICS